MKSLTDSQLLLKIRDLFLEKKLSLAVAESVTSGLLQNYFSRTDQAMQFFHGGMTLYNLGQKTRHLNVNPIVAENCNCVAKEVAEQMASEISHKFCSEIGIGITGYAARVPEEDITSLYSFVAIVIKGKLAVSKRMMGDPDKKMAENQEIYVRKTLEHLYEALKS